MKLQKRKILCLLFLWVTTNHLNLRIQILASSKLTTHIVQCHFTDSNFRILLLTKHIESNYSFKTEYELTSPMYKHTWQKVQERGKARSKSHLTIWKIPKEGIPTVYHRWQISCQSKNKQSIKADNIFASRWKRNCLHLEEKNCAGFF